MLLSSPSPLSESMIERVVEKRTDTLDKDFLHGRLDAGAYDANIAALTTWADREYARTRVAQ